MRPLSASCYHRWEQLERAAETTSVSPGSLRPVSVPETGPPHGGVRRSRRTYSACGFSLEREVTSAEASGATWGDPAGFLAELFKWLRLAQHGLCS